MKLIIDIPEEMYNYANMLLVKELPELKKIIANGTPYEERPKDNWIPISERLPKDRDWYLGLFKEPDTDFIGIPYICDYLLGGVTKFTTNEGWILRHYTDVDNPSDYFRNLICVAWRPLPEPYKEANNE